MLVQKVLMLVLLSKLEDVKKDGKKLLELVTSPHLIEVKKYLCH